MRIWDISPGYLNRQSLLGEHRELHGLVSILVNGKKGYSRHPETKRWVGYGWALRQRHKELACEMQLRGYTDRSPVRTRSNEGVWPPAFIDAPAVQFELLRGKYQNREEGRIPLPNNVQELWSHHKYSVLARNQNAYREIGRKVANRRISFATLGMELVRMLRIRPDEGNLRNALEHMWGYVSAEDDVDVHGDIASYSLKKRLALIQKKAQDIKEPYLVKSTALSELMAWL